MKEPLRIAHVLSVLDYGGVEAMAMLLLQRLPTDQFEHHLIFIGVDPPLRELEFTQQAASFTIVPYRFRRFLSFMKQISRTCQEHRIDAVLCHNFGHHPLIGLAARRAGVKRVYTVVASSPCSSPISQMKNRIKGLLGRMTCNLEVAVSSCVARELTTQIKLPARRIRTIANCCLAKEIGEIADQARTSRQPSTPQLLMVSRMDDAKDQDTLLYAVAKLIGQGRELHLSLAGEGPRKVLLEQLTEQLGIQEKVHFAGVCKNVPQLLGSSDIFVFATKTEGFGLVLIESMSAGTPIISSDLPVCRDILDHGSCGMLYPCGNVDALADSIAYMLDHADEAKQYAERARKRALTEYSPEKTIEQYDRLLHGELDVLPSNLSAT